MEKYTPATKSKLERIVKNAERIIDYAGPSDNLKSEYNSIKDDWNTLKDDLKEKWIDIKFTNNDFEFNKYLDFNKFSVNGKSNMQRIKGVCEDTLAEIVADEKKNETKKGVETNKKLKLNTSIWLTIIGILITIIIGITSQILEIRYEQGREAGRKELSDTLNAQLNTINAQQNRINNLTDSLEKFKLRNAELEKNVLN